MNDTEGDKVYRAAKDIFKQRYGREPRMALTMDRQRVALIEAELWKVKQS